MPLVHSPTLSRREALQGIAGGILGASLGDCPNFRVSENGPASFGVSTVALDDKTVQPLVGADAASLRMIWKLPRPKPVLPNSYFWTWDHSTNWMLDDPGVLNTGCGNRYLKQPQTFVEDYRRLTDMAAGLGIKGIMIAGFLRDAHGGIDAAKRVADYAASQGVAIAPCVGTNRYGGVYYEGDHPYNMETFLKKHPDASLLDAQGNPVAGFLCPTHPAFVDWLQEGLHWLFREFAVGGVNLENGDFLVCSCKRCQKALADWPQDEPEFWRYQYLGYNPALRAIEGHLQDKLITWATYKGFLPGSADRRTDKGASMGCTRPAVVDKLPAAALCQWTLSGMVRKPPLPLTAYLDQGVPAAALTAPLWPANVRPPTQRSVGYLHQGSQWSHGTRHDQVVASIKEACSRAHRAGLEGVSFHGEVSSMYVPCALNYLAFSHFIHWPEDSLREFGRKTLGQVFGSADEGEAFAELLAHWDAGTLSEEQRRSLEKRSEDFQTRTLGYGKNVQNWRFWNWLDCVATDGQDRQTVSFL